MTFAEAHNVIAAERATGRRSALLAAAETFADEVDRLNADLAAIRQDFEDQTYMLQQINETLAADHPAIAATIRQHPAARLRIVTADTAAPCDQ